MLPEGWCFIDPLNDLKEITTNYHATKAGVPTDSEELKPVDQISNTLSLH